MRSISIPSNVLVAYQTLRLSSTRLGRHFLSRLLLESTAVFGYFYCPISIFAHFQVKSVSPGATVMISNAIQNSEHMSDAQVEAMVKKLIPLVKR